jgi:hypothetical protein
MPPSTDGPLPRPARAPADLPASEASTIYPPARSGAPPRLFDELDFGGNSAAVVLELDAANDVSPRKAGRFRGPSVPPPATTSTMAPSRSSLAESEIEGAILRASPAISIRPWEPTSPCASLAPLPEHVHASVLAFAGFGPAPDSLAGAPAYTLRVLARRRLLVRGLIDAWCHRSLDADVYAAALRVVEEKAFRRGAIILAALGALVVGAIALAMLLLL